MLRACPERRGSFIRWKLSNSSNRRAQRAARLQPQSSLRNNAPSERGRPRKRDGGRNGRRSHEGLFLLLAPGRGPVRVQGAAVEVHWRTVYPQRRRAKDRAGDPRMAVSAEENIPQCLKRAAIVQPSQRDTLIPDLTTPLEAPFRVNYLAPSATSPYGAIRVYFPDADGITVQVSAIDHHA